MTTKFIIHDWAGNHLFPNEQFETFEDGDAFLDGYFYENNLNPEENRQEYYIIETPDPKLARKFTELAQQWFVKGIHAGIKCENEYWENRIKRATQ